MTNNSRTLVLHCQTGRFARERWSMERSRKVYRVMVRMGIAVLAVLGVGCAGNITSPSGEPYIVGEVIRFEGGRITVVEGAEG